MKKIIYHGSENVVENPIFGYGKKYNDYGLGFYTTESLELSKEWSVNGEKDGYSNKYEIEVDGLKVLYLNSEDYCVLHWLSLLLKNRRFDIDSPVAFEARRYILDNFNIPLDGIDIVIGYRADDSYFSFAQDFINGAISYEQLGMAMRLGKLGEQLVLISKKAFDRIRFIGYETVNNREWIGRKKERDITARREYSSFTHKYNKNHIYIQEIINKELKADDIRLR